MTVNNKVAYNKIKKKLIAEIEDPGWMTAFQPMVIADMLTKIYKIVDPDKQIKFEYYKKGSEFGFASVPDPSAEKKEE